MTQPQGINTEMVLAELKKRTRVMPTCEFCGGTRWTGGGFLAIPKQQGQLHQGQVLTLSGEYFLYMELSCQICGNTKLINLVLLGLVPPANESIARKIIDDALGPNNPGP